MLQNLQNLYKKIAIIIVLTIITIFIFSFIFMLNLFIPPYPKKVRSCSILQTRTLLCLNYFAKFAKYPKVLTN